MRQYPQPAVPGEMVSYLELAALPSAAYWARRHALAALSMWRLHAGDIETAQLLVSELITNAIKFTSPPPARLTHHDLAGVKAIALTLRYHAGTLIIEVCDPGPSPPLPAEAGPDAEHGRGLMLVQALSKEWNYYLPPAGGKTVYCVISAGTATGTSQGGHD